MYRYLVSHTIHHTGTTPQLRTERIYTDSFLDRKRDFHLARGNAADIRARMDDLMARRKDKQPLDKPSAGSTFKRPVGAFAAALIDQCGLRGYRHGGAAVSDKHCGFVVNLGGATCADVLALCDEVRAIVKEKTGYDLEKEIRVVEA